MADESKKKKFVVEEVVGDEEVHSEDLENKKEEETNTEEIEEKVENTEPEETPVNKEKKDSETPSEFDTETTESETPVETNSEIPMSAEPNSQAKPESKTNIKLVIILTAFFALILGGVAGGVLVFLSNSNPETQSQPSPTPIATTEPTPTPEPEVDKQSVKVNIQNGSGIAGEGGKMSEFLTDEGFSVGTVGNASSFDYEETIIQAKSSVSEDFLSALSKSLSKNYKVGENKTLTSGTADVVIVVGSEKTE